MTGSSSKLLQIHGKWYQQRNPKQMPKPDQKQKLFFTRIISPLYHHLFDEVTVDKNRLVKID
jgi:hypothetical protein